MCHAVIEATAGHCQWKHFEVYHFEFWGHLSATMLKSLRFPNATFCSAWKTSRLQVWRNVSLLHQNSACDKECSHTTFSFIDYVMELSFTSAALKRKEIPIGIYSQWGVHMEHFHLVWTYEQFLTGMCVFVSSNPVAYWAKLSFIHVHLFFTTILARQSGKQTHLFFF